MVQKNLSEKTRFLEIVVRKFILVDALTYGPARGNPELNSNTISGIWQMKQVFFCKGAGCLKSGVAGRVATPILASTPALPPC